MLDKIDNKISSLRAKLDVLQSDVDKSNIKIDSISKDILLLDQVNSFFSKQVDVKIGKIKVKIETLVNSGLSSIFDDSLKLVIDSSVKYSKTTFKLQVSHNGVIGMEKSHGGGVLSVVAFILRIVVTLLTDKRKFLIFDESLSMVSIGYQEKLSQFIRKLCDDLGFTILLVSHQPVLGDCANVKYEVVKKGNYTRLKKVENLIVR